MPQVASVKRDKAGRPPTHPGERLVSRGVCLPAADWEALRSIARASSSSVGAIVREAVRARLGGEGVGESGVEA